MIRVVEPGMGLASGDVDERLSAFHGRRQIRNYPSNETKNLL